MWASIILLSKGNTNHGMEDIPNVVSTTVPKHLLIQLVNSQGLLVLPISCELAQSSALLCPVSLVSVLSDGGSMLHRRETPQPPKMCWWWCRKLVSNLSRLTLNPLLRDLVPAGRSLYLPFNTRSQLPGEAQ